MRILFIASGEFALPTLDWLAQSEHEIPLVITQPAKPSGRGRKTTTTTIKQRATELGLEVLETNKVNDPFVLDRVRPLEVHLGVVIAFGQKLGDEFLAIMPGGCVNLHASLLPKYRGAAPIQRAIVNGEERSGCTVFRIVEKMDAGPILTSRWTSIKPEETAGQLHDRLARIGVDAVQATLSQFEGGAIPAGENQNHAEATLAPKLSKKDGYIRFDREALKIVQHVHGMTPWPGAAAVFRSQDGRWERVQLIRLRKAETATKPTATHGSIDDRLYVAAQDGYLEILEIKPSSGRIMTWSDYVNGRQVRTGDNFVTPDDHV